MWHYTLNNGGNLLSLAGVSPTHNTRPLKTGPKLLLVFSIKSDLLWQNNL